MTAGQLNIFHASRLEPFGGESESPVTPSPNTASGEPASRPQPHDHAGQPGDDGSLHYMLTGQPEPRAA